MKRSITLNLQETSIKKQRIFIVQRVSSEAIADIEAIFDDYHTASQFVDCFKSPIDIEIMECVLKVRGIPGQKE